MEGLGIAASVGCFFGLAGQIAQGVKFLHSFFGDIKDAPADIASLVAELATLRLLLNAISTPQNIMALSAASGICSEDSTVPTSSQDFSIPVSEKLMTEEVRPALDHCELWVNKLQQLVLLYEPNAKLSKRKRVWAQIDIALRKKKFQKYIEGLERAKSMLQQAQIGMIVNSIATANRISMRISSELTALTRNQSLLTSNMIETISAITSLEQNVDTLKSAVHSSLSQISPYGRSSQRPPLPEKYPLNRIQNKIGFISLHPHECACARTKSAVSKHDSTRNLEGRNNYQEQCTTLENFPKLSSRRERTDGPPEDTISAKSGKNLIASASRHTFWGSILMSTEKREVNLYLSHLVTEILLLPASWLLRTGFTLTITRIVSEYTKPSLTYSLRPIEIITNTNPVLPVMLDGDILKVQKYFANRVVSPFATFSNGFNLLHVLVYIMFNMSLGTFSYCTELDDWSDITGVPLTQWGQQDPRRVWTQWENYKHMFAWLCSLGVKIGAKSDNPRTPMQYLFRILRLDTDSFDEEHLFPLAISAVEAAKNNPLYVHHSGEIGGILRNKCLRGGEWSPLNRLPSHVLDDEERTICTEGDQCVATAVLDEIAPPAMAESPDWEKWISMRHEYRWSVNLFRRRSQAESKFIRNIVDGIPTSTNSEMRQSFANAMVILLGTIKNALLHGSPLKVSNQCPVDKHLVRNAIIGDVACMIPADPLLASFHLEGGTITTWSRKWRVLDLWRKALFRRGFSSADVDWLTGKAWSEDNNLYYDTVEGENGLVDPDWEKLYDTEDIETRPEVTFKTNNSTPSMDSNRQDMIVMNNAFSAHPAISLLS